MLEFSLVLLSIGIAYQLFDNKRSMNNDLLEMKKLQEEVKKEELIELREKNLQYEIRQDIRKLKNQGIPSNVIADMYGISYSKVNRICGNNK